MRWLLLLMSLAACGDITRETNDSGVHDAKLADTPLSDAPADASIDGPPPTESREIVSGGARLTSATYQLDVQVGDPLSQATIAGATYTLEGNAAVKP